MRVSGSTSSRQQFLRARELLVVLRFGGELELADALEVAVDTLLGDDGLDLVHAGIECAIEHVGPLATELGRQSVIVLREAVVAHAAVAPRRGIADAAGLEHHDLGAFLCECERRRKSGEAGADDRDIGIAVRGPFGRQRKMVARYRASRI